MVGTVAGDVVPREGVYVKGFTLIYEANFLNLHGTFETLDPPVQFHADCAYVGARISPKNSC